MKLYCTRYRPADTADGRGGRTETLASPVTLAMDTEIHDGTLQMKVDADEDVDVGDVLEFTENVW